jgi:hypothetical protein
MEEIRSKMVKERGGPMRTRWFLLGLALAFLQGCKSRDQLDDLPGYEITIPGDVPERMTLTQKDGTQEEGNGRELYAKTHRQGWAECWQRFQRGELDLADESAEPMPVQEFGIEQQGRRDGFEACRRWLLRSKR